MPIVKFISGTIRRGTFILLMIGAAAMLTLIVILSIIVAIVS